MASTTFEFVSEPMESFAEDEPRCVATEAQLRTLRESISNRPPFCNGTRVIPAEDFILFFIKGTQAYHIDISRAVDEQINLLVDACSPATFGLNQEDVLDETYRKAGKLDKKLFATNFHPENNGILDIVRSELLSGLDSKKPIRFELYKLNVYWQGSFFKAHKDTPRAENMFGSLVIIYPTKHQGGELVLRHRGQEWTFDAASEVASASEQSVGYVVFFSDVEHEVSTVTSGTRVTLTYNLYFAEDAVAEVSSISSSTQRLATKFQDTFSKLLRSPEFLPEGGYLGFGLDHQYAFSRRSGFPTHALSYLKGSDAVVFAVAQALGLEVSLKLVYKTDESEDGQLITERFVTFYEYTDLNVLAEARQDSQGDIVAGGADEDEDEMETDEENEEKAFINWVTDMRELNTLKEAYMAYGNEASLNFVYGDFCLLVRVGPPGKR